MKCDLLFEVHLFNLFSLPINRCIGSFFICLLFMFFISSKVLCLCSMLFRTLMTVRAATGLDILLLIMPFLYRFFMYTIFEA